MQERYFQINASGHSVKCKLYCDSPKAVKRVVLYGHGFGGHKDNKAAQRFAEFVLKKYRDVAVMTYNAPCHGDDVKKKLRLEDCGAYIQLVTEYAKRQWRTEELYVYATSFGGYQFLKFIAENGNPYRKIALRCPAVNMVDVLSQRIMSADEQKALARNKPVAVGFDRKINVTRQFLDELRAADLNAHDFRAYASDILILHGTKDEVVPFDTAQAFAAKNGIPFVPVENADHRFKDPLKMDFAMKQITAFFEW